MLVSITIIYIESLNTNYVQTTLNCTAYLTSLLGYRDNCVKSLEHIINKVYYYYSCYLCSPRYCSSEYCQYNTNSGREK